jgi:hypothetical protein
MVSSKRPKRPKRPSPPPHLVIYNLFFNLYSNGRQLLLIKFTKKQNKELFQLPIIASTITSIVIFNIYARIYHTKWRAPGAVSWTPPPTYIFFCRIRPQLMKDFLPFDIIFSYCLFWLLSSLV